MLVVHTSIFKESPELFRLLEMLQQKEELIHLHLKHLKNDEDWDEALESILQAERVISV